MSISIRQSKGTNKMRGNRELHPHVAAVRCSLAGAALIVLLCLPAAAAEGSFERTLHVTGAVNLDISTGSGSVQVRTGSGSEVRISGHIKSTDWFGNNEDRVKQIEANPPIQQSGNDIRIGHLDSDLLHNISISYELLV